MNFNIPEEIPIEVMITINLLDGVPPKGSYVNDPRFLRNNHTIKANAQSILLNYLPFPVRPAFAPLTHFPPVTRLFILPRWALRW